MTSPCRDRRRALTSAAALVGVLAFLAVTLPVVAGDPNLLTTKKIKGRDGKLLHQALYAKDGRLGFLHDVDDDGHEDFVFLAQHHGNDLAFHVMKLIDNESRIRVELGEGYPAGLGMVNLDDDEAPEFVAAYGSRRDRLTKKALAMTGTIIASALFSFYTAPQTGYVTTFTYVGAPSGLDLQDLVAIDDDGSILWRRDLREKDSGGRLDEVRFRMLVPVDNGKSVMVVLTNNVGNQVLGISGESGETVWRTPLPGAEPAAKWSNAGLMVAGTVYPALFLGNRMVVLDPRDGSVKLSEQFEMSISQLPAWTVFGTGDDAGILVFSDERSRLEMVSIATGKPVWGRDVEGVRTVLPLGTDSFAVVWKHGLQVLESDGSVVLDATTPDKVKTVFDPVIRDIDGDGSFEFVFVSGKKVLCWNPRSDRVLWKESLASFVGGANPVALYDAFYDLDGDGWLDVPAATGGGKGRWLSGKTGEVILEVGSAFANPLVGDWDGNGLLELFWWNNWNEIHPPKAKN